MCLFCQISISRSSSSSQPPILTSFNPGSTTESFVSSVYCYDRPMPSLFKVLLYVFCINEFYSKGVRFESKLSYSCNRSSSKSPSKSSSSPQPSFKFWFFKTSCCNFWSTKLKLVLLSIFGSLSETSIKLESLACPPISWELGFFAWFCSSFSCETSYWFKVGLTGSLFSTVSRLC